VGERFSALPDRLWGPPSLLYNVYRVFPGVKLRPGHAANHSHPSGAVVRKSRALPLPTLRVITGPETGSLYVCFTFLLMRICSSYIWERLIKVAKVNV